jgi:hypothetical protein
LVGPKAGLDAAEKRKIGVKEPVENKLKFY